jgi:hypothetical protein
MKEVGDLLQTENNIEGIKKCHVNFKKRIKSITVLSVVCPVVSPKISFVLVQSASVHTTDWHHECSEIRDY